MTLHGECRYTECHCAKCRRAKCHCTDCRGASLKLNEIMSAVRKSEEERIGGEEECGGREKEEREGAWERRRER